jgi:cobalamin-dependent methionine synthase I
VGEAARKLCSDAQAMLTTASSTRSGCTAGRRWGSSQANSDAHDDEVLVPMARVRRTAGDASCTLRQQMVKRVTGPNLALADFVACEQGLASPTGVGAFA